MRYGAGVVATSPDGRRARRERNRAAVIDAVFELVREGQVPPPVEDVAARAEVSVSSVFRYFDDLDDMHAQTVARYFERYDPLFEVPARPDGDVQARIEALVDARLDLYEAVAPIARWARVQAATQPTIAETLRDTRRRLARQVRAHLEPDLGERADGDELAAAADALTSFESWDLLRGAHGRSRASVRRVWTTALEALLR